MLSLYRLPHQLPDEKVVKVLRRDVFILFRKIVLSSVLLVAPLLLLGLGQDISPGWLTGPVSYPVVILSGSIYYLFIWLFSFFSFIDYYLDVWIITNERIIDIKQHGFFSRVISEQRLYRIQDVTSEVHGFWPTLLKYGDVYVQTAAEMQRFFFHEVSHPEMIRDTLIGLAEKSKARHRYERIEDNTPVSGYYDPKRAPNRETDD